MNRLQVAIIAMSVFAGALSLALIPINMHLQAKFDAQSERMQRQALPR